MATKTAHILPVDPPKEPEAPPEPGVEGATRAEINPHYEGGKAAPVNTQPHSSPLATAGVDRPSDKREVDEDGS
jgi:hypothetical protein